MNDYTTIVPALEDVGLLINTRTIDSGGVELGAFSAATRPTDVQVLALAGNAAREVMSALGIEDVPDELITDCQQLVALRTAQLIELSFYGDTNSEAAATLAAAYLAGLGTLQDRLHWTALRLA